MSKSLVQIKYHFPGLTYFAAIPHGPNRCPLRYPLSCQSQMLARIHPLLSLLMKILGKYFLGGRAQVTASRSLKQILALSALAV